MKDTPQMIAGTWWAGLSREDFYKIVHAKQEELRRDERFGHEVPKGNGPGRPSSTRVKVSD